MKLNGVSICELTESQISFSLFVSAKNKRHFEGQFCRSFDLVLRSENFHGGSAHSKSLSKRARKQEIQLDTPLTCKREVCVKTLSVFSRTEINNQKVRQFNQQVLGAQRNHKSLCGFVEVCVPW